MDFESEDRLIRHSSYRYIFPPMIGMVFAQMAPVVDGIAASGGIGEDALSAIGIVGPFVYVLNIICALFGIGCGVLISRCSGTGEKAKAARIFTRTLVHIITLTILISVLGIVFIDQLLMIFSATPENFSYAKEYFLVILAGSVFTVINFVGDYILANDNNENLAVAGDITGAVVNMIIDYVGIFVFHQGIWIVGFGTVASSFVCMLVYLLHFTKKDRLCRLVKPECKDGDPNIYDIVKAGAAEAIMYLGFAVQLAVQNFILRDDGGTSGLGNSAIIENLSLIFTIVIAGCTDAIFPMASAYQGEQNKSGMLMVKRNLTKTGFLLLMIPVSILMIFPQLTIIPYRIDDPVMLRTLPSAIRLVSINQLVIFICTLFIDYLSATEQEGKANIAFLVQFIINIPLIVILNNWTHMNSPWYASIIAQFAVLIYLCFFCGDLPKGMRYYQKENLQLLKGGYLTQSFVSDFSKEAEKIISVRQIEILKKEMIDPLMQVLSEEKVRQCSFSILKRDDDKMAVNLHYESKKDLLENLPEIELDDDDEDDKDEEVPVDTCIRSEFLGMRRLMIILSDK